MKRSKVRILTVCTLQRKGCTVGLGDLLSALLRGNSCQGRFRMTTNVGTLSLCNMLHNFLSGCCHLDVFGISQGTRGIVMGSNSVSIAECAFGFVLIRETRWSTRGRIGIRAVVTRDGVNYVGQFRCDLGVSSIGMNRRGRSGERVIQKNTRI